MWTEHAHKVRGEHMNSARTHITNPEAQCTIKEKNIKQISLYIRVFVLPPRKLFPDRTMMLYDSFVERMKGKHISVENITIALIKLRNRAYCFSINQQAIHSAISFFLASLDPVSLSISPFLFTFLKKNLNYFAQTVYVRRRNKQKACKKIIL